MNIEEFENIMNDESGENDIHEKGCNVIKGILIMQKYLPFIGVEAAGYEVIYSAGISELVEAGITKSDAILLRRQNWMIDEDDLACFV